MVWIRVPVCKKYCSGCDFYRYSDSEVVPIVGVSLVCWEKFNAGLHIVPPDGKTKGTVEEAACEVRE